MGQYRVWYSTKSFADYIIDHTNLKGKVDEVNKRKMYESDANNAKNFHKLPDHIKKILYLDAPDLIVEYNMEPIFSIEITTEAGTGHNAFQRFARIAAAVENNVPAIYIYPEAAIITRDKKEQSESTKWDSINPLIFQALKRVREIYKIPALLFYYPSDYREFTDALKSPHINRKGLKYDEDIFKYTACPDSNDSEMQKLFATLNLIISEIQNKGIIKGREDLLSRMEIMERTDWMDREFHRKSEGLEIKDMSPITATIKIDTQYLLNHLRKYSKDVPELLASRKETIIYQVNADWRGDPYPGALSALDYLLCREGKTFEERKYNLVLCWGTIAIDTKEKNFGIYNSIPRVKKIASINDFIRDVQSCGTKNLLNLDYKDIKKKGIPRYYMQVRYGSMYSKVKHIRVFSYFADAILFNDGALWREG